MSQTSQGTLPSLAPDQDIERLLLLSLIRSHLRRASTDALHDLERDLRGLTSSESRGR